MRPVIALDHAAQCDVVFVDVHGLAVEPRVNENLVAGRRAVDRILNAISLADLDDGGLCRRSGQRQRCKQATGAVTREMA